MYKKMKILTKWLFIVSFVQAILLYTFFGLIYLPAQRNFLQNSLLDRMKAKAGFYFPAIKKALESKNDILIMNSLENLSRDSEVMYARLIDNNGRVTAHNKIQDWGKKLDNAVTKQIIASNEPEIIKIDDGYDYSIPVVSSTTKIASFSFGITLDKVNIIYIQEKNRAIKTALIIFIITTAAYFLVFRALIILPLIQLQKRIKSAILGQVGERLALKRNDELGSLAATIDKLIEKLTK